MPSGSTVRDNPDVWYGWGGGAARSAGGDGERRGNITMPGERAMRAGHDPAPRLRNPFPAGRAGRRGPTLVDQEHSDAGQGGFVLQDAHRPADLPLPQPQVVPVPCWFVQDPAWVPDCEGADPLIHRPPDQRGGGLVQCLPDPAAVPALDQPGTAPGLAPPPWPALPLGRGASCGGAAAGFGVGQMHPVLGPDRPPRHQQSGPVTRAGGGERMDDPQIHPSHAGRIRLSVGRVGGHGEFGGDVHPQPAGVEHQRHRPDGAGRVGHGPVQAYQQRQAAAGGR